MALETQGHQYLVKLVREWRAWAGLVMELLSIFSLRPPEGWPDALPWWALFFIGALLLFWAQFRVWIKTVKEYSSGARTLKTELDKLRDAVYGRKPLVGANLELVKAKCKRTPDIKLDESLRKMIERAGIGERLPYMAVVVLKTTAEINTTIVVRWSEAVESGYGEYYNNTVGENHGANTDHLDNSTLVYRFPESVGVIPEGTKILLIAYCESLSTHCMRVEARPD